MGRHLGGDVGRSIRHPHAFDAGVPIPVAIDGRTDGQRFQFGQRVGQRDLPVQYLAVQRDDAGHMAQLR